MANPSLKQKLGSRGPHPTEKGELIGVRRLPEMRSPPDAWIDPIGSKSPSRPGVVRLILKDWLTGHGCMRHREEPEGEN